MPRHELGLVCPSCDEKILSGHPLLQSCWKTIKTGFPEAHLSWVWRDKENQNKFFAEGRTQLKWPHSTHNYMFENKPCSLAIDIFKLVEVTKALFPPRFYYDINKFIEDNYLPLEWSGRWNEGKKDGFKEMDHFQLKEKTLYV
jgi:hypothetical protein